MNWQTIDTLYASDKLVFEHLPPTVWAIFSSFLIYCCCCTCLKAREISPQNLRNSENILSYCIRNHAIAMLIANTKKYLQSDWLRGVQY